MKYSVLATLFKISMIARQVFDRKTGAELDAIKEHFGNALNDAQLCAMVVIKMIMRVFVLPAEADTTARSGPSPLDDVTAQALRDYDAIDSF